jgi:predicted small lipoprotein YifL
VVGRVADAGVRWGDGEQDLPSNRLGVGWTLAVAVALALALAGCGRKGPLDPPPDSAVPVVPPGAAPSNYLDPTTPTGAAQPAPVPASQLTAPPPAKTFLLDPLIR